MTAPTVMVTGGAGFIGSALVRHLVANTGYRVAVVDKLTYAGGRASLAQVSTSARFRFFHDDVSNAPRMAAVLAETEPDIIMHLAAETHVDRSIDDAEAFIQSNVVGTFVLLDAALTYWRRLSPARQRAFRFHHVSTDEVFGALGAVGVIDEASPYRPSSPYAASKAASDHLVRAWHATHGLPVVITNCGNNFGPYQFPEKLIPLAILNALEYRDVPVYGRGENVRDWLFVDDHVRALLAVSERGQVGQTYLIGGSGERTNLEVIAAVCANVERAAGNDGGRRQDLIRFVADRPGHDHRYAIDATKIRSELGWTPLVSFDTGLDRTVRWYLANRQWWAPLRADLYGGERLGLVP